jgi:hypothetical protein
MSRLGSVFGLKVFVRSSAMLAYSLLWGMLAALGIFWLDLPWPQAILGGLVCSLLHAVGEFFHNLGHAWAARRTGYPMEGVLYWGLLATSLYPKDEPILPGKVHIQRALGGPFVSLLAALVSALLALALQNAGVWTYILLFFCLDNLFVFTLGALLPVRFTDGGTILSWWKKR